MGDSVRGSQFDGEQNVFVFFQVIRAVDCDRAEFAVIDDDCAICGLFTDTAFQSETAICVCPEFTAIVAIDVVAFVIRHKSNSMVFRAFLTVEIDVVLIVRLIFFIVAGDVPRDTPFSRRIGGSFGQDGSGQVVVYIVDILTD